MQIVDWLGFGMVAIATEKLKTTKHKNLLSNNKIEKGETLLKLF